MLFVRKNKIDRYPHCSNVFSLLLGATILSAIIFENVIRNSGCYGNPNMRDFIGGCVSAFCNVKRWSEFVNELADFIHLFPNRFIEYVGAAEAAPNISIIERSIFSPFDLNGMRCQI